MNTLDYLPRGDKTAEVASVLDTYLHQLYFVGPAARKKIYGFTHGVDGFDFIVDGDPEDGYLVDDDFCDAAFPVEGNSDNFTVDANGYDVRVRVMSLADYLCEQTYSGDGVAMRVKDGRVICIPEYITMPPTEAAGDLTPDERKALPPPTEALKTFEKELVTLAEKMYGRPPVSA